MNTYPPLDEDDGDLLLDRMETRIRILDGLASETLNGASSDYSHDLIKGIQVLHRDWRLFRHELVTAIRKSAERGYIQLEAKR